MKDLRETLARLPPEKRAALELMLEQRRRPVRREIRPADRTRPLPLSFAQQRLWFLERFEGETGAYNVPMGWRLSGPLDDRALEAALAEIVRRHEALRTTFPLAGGAPVQEVHPQAPLPLKRIELARDGDPEARVEALFREHAAARFDLEHGPLLRAALVRISEQEHVLLLAFHHIACDGWSIGVFARELSALYAARVEGRPSPLAPLPIQYGDFAAWQRQALSAEILASEREHWARVLEGAPLVLDVSPDRPRPPVQRFRGSTHRFTLDPLLSGRVKACAQTAGATPFMVLLSAFSALLARRSGQEDLLIGTPVAQRTLTETEPLIGCFINTLVMRTRPRLEGSFRALLSQVKTESLIAFEHQDLPLEQVIDRMRPERSLSHSPLFQVMFILQNAPPPVHALPGIRLTHLVQQDPPAKFDLTLVMREQDGVFRATFEYDAELFTAATIERMAGHFRQLLAAATAEPSRRLCDLPLLEPEERRQILVEWNRTRAPVPEADLVTQVLSVAAASPGTIAISSGDTGVTYRQLADRVRLLGRHLVEQGVTPEEPVGVLLTRGPELVEALLGVLASGGAYLPLDPSFPRERLAYMLQDAGVRTVIVSRETASLLPDPALRVIDLDRDRGEISTRTALDPPPRPGGALAYVLYTSGSTGRPKGVEIPHRALSNLLASMAREPGFSSSDSLLSVTTVSFDIAALELFLPLITGGRLVLASRADAAEGKRLAALLEQSGATVMQATPATWRMMLASGWKPKEQVRIWCGGEALPIEVLEALRSGGAEVWNLYGPTETTIWSLAVRVDDVRAAPPGRSPPIGRPIANTRALVLDRFGAPVPIGVPGELHLGGVGLARGYRGAPELTRARFVASPVPETAALLGPGEDDRLYRTGDRARLLPDGRLEFLGRFDHQVKLRGFRVELGEIEAVAAEHPAVASSAASIREDVPGEPRLVLYFVARKGVAPTAEELRAHLRRTLPEYMVPSSVVRLERMPLTANAKIDRSALPKPVVEAAPAGAAVPSAPLERELVRIWEDVLGVAPIGLEQSFFELGGHSLLAVVLLSRIEKTFGRAVPLATLFAGPTVSELARAMQAEAPPPSRALETLQPIGRKTPLFFVGSTPYARLLIPYLGSDQPLYGLNIFGLERFDHGPAAVDLRQVAAEYLREMRSVQPRGPYRIAAYCADAILAFELAQQLRAEGEEISLLAFIDTVWGFDREVPFDAVGFALNLREFRGSFLRQKLERRTRSFTERWAARRDRWEGRMRRAMGEDVSLRLRHVELIRAYRRALATHSAQPFEGKIVLFVSKEMRRRQQPELVRLALGGLETREIPGFHDALFESPAIEVLARELAACLAETERGP